MRLDELSGEMCAVKPVHECIEATFGIRLPVQSGEYPCTHVGEYAHACTERQTCTEPRMLTENDIIDAVVAHLGANGYRVDKICTTAQRGIDIEATRLVDSRRLVVEAKGGTSSKPGTNRHGKPFSNGQAGHHVAVALYTAAKLTQRFPGSADIALALPDDTGHQKAVAPIASVLDTLGIQVYWVSADRRVRESRAGAAPASPGTRTTR